MKNSLVLCAAAAAMCICASGQTRNSAHHFNINTQGDPESCADLKVTSRDGELARSAQHFEMSRSEASRLELNAAERGVVRVRGWSQPGFSVEACKLAVANDQATAQGMLQSIAVSRSAGRISYTGPANSEGEWQVYFIIHAPDHASLDLEARNAPVSISGVNGEIKVRSLNGPLAIRASGGNIDAQTTNGPIAFEGESGEVHLLANNGPISVKLQKEVWNGATFEAKTVNGPMSLSLPPAFQSGVRVETAGHTMVSCGHDACAHAVTNASGDRKVIQLNGSSEVVKVTTENGPLSIGELKAKRIL